MEDFVLTFIAENSTEIISASSAIFGVILGWILQYITRRGKIKFLSTESKMIYFAQDVSGIPIDVKSLYNAQHVSIAVTLDIYNSSAYNRNVMRSMRLMIKENTSLMSYVRSLFAIRDVHEIEFMEKDYLSLNPQEYKEVHLEASLSVAQAEMMGRGKLYLQYIGVNSKKKYTTLNKPELILTPPSK